MRKVMKRAPFFLLSLTMSCFLGACSFFETPSKEPSTAPTENVSNDVTLKDEANGTTGQTAVSNETWNALATDYARLEKDYQALKEAYEADPRKANSDVDLLLQQAKELIDPMGSTKRSQITEKDAVELQQMIATMDESINELYMGFIPEEEKTPAPSTAPSSGETVDEEETAPNTNSDEGQSTEQEQSNPTNAFAAGRNNP